MRELVYISKRKIRQFDLGRRAAFGARLKAAIKAPLGLGELTLETDIRQKDVLELDAVINALESSDRAATWFTESVQPGQWVQFEAPMSYTVLAKAVVFLDVDQQSAAYPTGGKVRLVLHGSSEHLAGNDSTPQASIEELSQQASANSSIDAEAFASVFNHFFSLIDYGARQDVDSLESDGAMSWHHRIQAASLDYVIPTLGRHLRLPHTAAWMAGYARVTAVTSMNRQRSAVFASPLYVEYVPPSNER